MITRIGVALLLCGAVTAGLRADTYPRQPGVDALHYVFRLTIGDGSDEIAGEATARVRLVADGVQELGLDLTSASGGKGMTVSAVTSEGHPVAFTHEHDRLRIPLAAPCGAGDERSFVIHYHGAPAEGLRLIANMHGERTIFSENWPNHARHWLPTIDHPYDKATGEFIVTAPAHYQVIANGLLIEEMDLGDGRRRTHWKQSVPIASWLFALGVARFAAHHAGLVEGVPLETWVFPEDRDAGYSLFEETAREAMRFFSGRIGPYAYEKLANVQAAGLSGGTEHASVIFYGEKGVAAGHAPIVHEIAHQWWGNAVTERDWDDVWLSEGFATYFTLLFAEHTQGYEAFIAGLKSSRARIVELEAKLPDTPVIHRNLSDMGRVLNQLVYQKGGWTLHMLRNLVGADAFFNGIREYYRRYQNANASSDDLRRVMEEASGVDLGWFFSQWLTRSGVPRLEGTWRYDAAGKAVEIALAQTQEGNPFRLTVDIGVRQPAHPLLAVKRVEFSERRSTFRLPADAEPEAVILDPHTWLLMEAGTFTKAVTP